MGVAAAFFYAGLLGLAAVIATGLAISTRVAGREPTDAQHLGSLLLAYMLLPLFLAVPFYEGVGNTTFLNAYVEMVSSLTTTGATMFGAPGRVADSICGVRLSAGAAGC
jgi:trk system potassium uptake protein TrkH